MTARGFRYESHTADVQVIASGADLAEALRNAARACTNLLTKVDAIVPRMSREIHVVGDSREQLVFRFLEQIVYALDAEHFVCSDARLTVHEGRVQGVLLGDSIELYERHGDIKAPTKHALAVVDSARGVEITFVLDV